MNHPNKKCLHTLMKDHIRYWKKEGATVYVRVITRSAVKNGGVAILAVLTTILLLRYPNAVHNGINRGLSICYSVIIPTLFPFMLLAGWLADSSLCRHPGRWTQAVTRRLFGLPGCCAPAILLSLVGGYPAGMVAISRLYRQGQLRREELRRMTAFCICGGPGFIVGTVGIGLLGSAHAGWLLYAAQSVSAVGIGILCGRRKSAQEPTPILPPPPRKFTSMVADTCGALVSMCGFVAAAAMVLSLIEGMGIPRSIAAIGGCSAAIVSTLLAGILEVSCGCIAVANLSPAPLWLSLCLSWGGLSVHGQLAAALTEEKVVNLRFWGWRLLHGATSALLALGLFHFFPPRQSVNTSLLSPLPFSVSASSSYMLLILCFLTMLCFSEKKTGKTA